MKGAPHSRLRASRLALGQALPTNPMATGQCAGELDPHGHSLDKPNDTMHDAQGIMEALIDHQESTKFDGDSPDEATAQPLGNYNPRPCDNPFRTAPRTKDKQTETLRDGVRTRGKHGVTYPTWCATARGLAGRDSSRQHDASRRTDSTGQEDASEQMAYLALYDPLTNLPNRRMLRDRLRCALANSTRSKRYGALLLMDVDNFKVLNDTLGHYLGDLFLRQLAERLLGCVRATDTVARLGGDEFGIVLEDLGDSPGEAAVHAEAIGEMMLASAREPYRLGCYDYCCTASIGMTLFSENLVAEDLLLRHGDFAMYQAKQAGRNSLCCFDPAMQAVLMEQAALETSLHRALEDGQLMLHYQMQTTQDGDVVGVEALLRWQHPERGLISPREFIPRAEETGLMLSIGQWVLETAVTQLRIWRKSSPTARLRLAINVCARQFFHADFVANIRATLGRARIDPNCLTLELTESAVICGNDEAIARMEALKTLGVRVSLDDYGTGHFSVAQLARLPLDELKIAPRLVGNIGVSESDNVIVKAIIGLAKDLGMEVVAEGVETEVQRLFLERHGCGLCQGYLFSRPLPIEAFEQLRDQRDYGLKDRGRAIVRG